MDIYIPTYLYIKQHSVTGKLYFGKTINDPETYSGSGSHWRNHIRIHGRKHIVTLWYCLFYDEDSINEFALNFSEQQNIIKSKDWLNLINEDGKGGGMLGIHHTEETKEKLRIANLGKIQSEETKHKRSLSLSGENNPNFDKEFSEEHRSKIRNSKKGQSYEIITCPKCGKSGGSNIMKRTHFDNCGKVTGVMTGKTHTEESKKKNSDSRKGKGLGKHETCKCPYCPKVGSVRIMKQWHFDKCKFKV